MAKSGYGLMIGMMILMMFCAKNMPSMGKLYLLVYIYKNKMKWKTCKNRKSLK